MLNESWQTWKMLKTLPIREDVEAWHPLIHTLPNSEKNLLRVRLNKQGHVTSVEDIGTDERVNMRRIVQTSDGSFPIIKVNQPFVELPKSSRIWNELENSKTTRERLNLLKSVLVKSKIRQWKDAGWHWNDSLKKADLILDELSNRVETTIAVTLTKAFRKALESKNAFIKETMDVALNKLYTGRLSALKCVQELIIGKGTDETDKKISVLLVLDLDSGGTFYTKETWKNVAAVLPTNLAAKERSHKHAASTSAFGEDGALLTEPFPQVKLPVLNAYFPLVSMASDGTFAKCQKRYGLTEYTVVPVTSSQARQMGGSLDWLVTRKEGTTWRGVASGRFEKKKELQDLLIVYVEEKPELDEKVASLFGSGDEIALTQFEVDTRAVCDALDGIVRVNPKSKLNLFLIRKASDGQAQIALAKTLKVESVLNAAERWKKAGRDNLPLISIYLPQIQKKDEIIPAVKEASPFAPFPDQVVRLMSQQWIKDGSKAKGQPQKIVGPGLGDVISVMLREEGKWEPVAKNMISLLVRRLGALLVGAFGAQHAYVRLDSKKKEEPFPRNSRETALRAIAVLGILLDSLNIKKEKYMGEATFKIGQVLSLADTLHKDYCIVVRKGKLPNTLIGTSLMRRALDNPAGALADLSERMMEYLRWAKVAHVSTEWSENDPKMIAVNEARKKLRQYQPLADGLCVNDLPTECNDVMKAQLLLGFLASQPTDIQNENGKENKQ